MSEIGIYIRMVWLFVIVITFLILLICYLHLSMRRSLEREALSLEFSYQAIEGMETERRRISLELHDTVLPQVQGQAVSDTIRTICLELMPPDFSRLSLKDCLADLCRKFTIKTGRMCVCSIDEKLKLSAVSADNQLNLYRIVQELLTNIKKHSKAKQAAVVVRPLIRGTTENILVCVSDDGIGIPEGILEGNGTADGAANGTANGIGLGLKGIRQRAAMLKAQLDFISDTGNGLMVRIELPAAPSPQYGTGNG
jgi:signal transduction histidine kinase